MVQKMFRIDSVLNSGGCIRGIIAYQLAMDWPDRVKRLVILNAPHPDAWIASWLTHPEQQRNVALDPILNEIASAWIDEMEVVYFPKRWHWLASEKPRAVTRHLREFFSIQ